MCVFKIEAFELAPIGKPPNPVFNTRIQCFKQAKQTLHDLLEESSALHGHEPETITHTSNALLTKHLYVKTKHVTHTRKSSRKQSKTEHIAGDTDKFDTAIATATGSSSSSSTVVKLENPAKLRVKEKLTVLRTGKTSLAKSLEMCRDLSESAQQLPQQKIDDVGGNTGAGLIGIMERHLHEIRVLIVTTEVQGVNSMSTKVLVSWIQKDGCGVGFSSSLTHPIGYSSSSSPVVD